MTRRPELILLDGATGSGKTMVLENMRKIYKKTIVVGAKFTTREMRPTDSSWEFAFVDRIPDQHRSYAFKSVGNYYALDVYSIRDAIANQAVYAVSCVDGHVMERLKREFTTLSLYVFRNTSIEDLSSLMKARKEKESALRLAERTSLLTKYANRMESYDHVILNVGSKEDVRVQLSAILKANGITDDQVATHKGSST